MNQIIEEAMEKTARILLIFIGILIVPKLVLAQDHIVHGVVHAFDSIPLQGVEIYVKSTKQTVFTDQEGNFTVPCNSKDKLKIGASGFASRNVKINEKIKIVAVNLKLKQIKDIQSEEIRQYAIGYGHVLERDKTTATESLRKNEAAFSRYTTMYELLRGQFSGVEVTHSGDIIVRGENSFNSSSSALIIVDGVIVESDFLNVIRPVDVKNVHVIKDGSTAVYGSRGANGVVLIETRKGGDKIQ